MKNKAFLLSEHVTLCEAVDLVHDDKVWISRLVRFRNDKERQSQIQCNFKSACFPKVCSSETFA